MISRVLIAQNDRAPLGNELDLIKAFGNNTTRILFTHALVVEGIILFTHALVYTSLHH